MELRNSVQPTSLHEIRRKLETLVSPYTGVVRGAVEFTRATDDSHLFNFGCRLSDPGPVIGARGQTVSNAVHPNRDVAWVAAVAEAVERYSSFFRPDLAAPTRPAQAVPNSADPASFALFHASQYAVEGFPYARFTPELPVRWKQGYRLPSLEPIWLPSQLVYLTDAPGEPKIAYSTSSGTALGGSREEAILSAIFECVERDAFMLAWKNALSMPALDVERAEALRAEDVRLYADSGLTSVALDLSALAEVPTVVVTVRSERPGQPAIAVGAACARTLAEAYRKAKREAYQTRVLARQLLRSHRSFRFASDYSDVLEFDHHILLHAQDGNLSRFFDAGPERIPLHGRFDLPANVSEAIACVVERLCAQQVDVHYADVTAPDIAEAGLSVARVVCPQLCRLDVGHPARFLGGDRLYARPAELGLLSARRSIDTLNPIPHPFP